MQKKFRKATVILAVMLLAIMPAFTLATHSALAADTSADFWSGGTTNDEAALRGKVGLGDSSPAEVAASVINVLLSFLGIVAVVIILLGGFKWMTAGGNEEKVEEAQKLIRAGIIGLIIIIAAWGIASFVIDQLSTATGAGTTT